MLQYTVGNRLTSLCNILLDELQFCNTPIWDEIAEAHKNGDNHIQKFGSGDMPSDI